VLRGFSLSRIERVYLVFSSGVPWYRGGLRGWAGASGRLDIVARVLAAACGPGVAVAVSLRGPSLVLVECGGVVLDEVDGGPLLLSRLPGVIGLDAREFIGVLGGAGFRLVLLREACGPPKRVEGRVAFVLGADVDPPAWVEGVVDECWSIGPGSYLASVVAAYTRVLAGLD